MQPKKCVVCVFFSFLLCATAVSAHELTSGPLGHAPIGVMGDHLHKKGEWMTSYRYMKMDMNNSYEGTDKLSDNEAIAQYPIAPVKMDMEMHMTGIMYAPTDDLTMMLMIPYVYKSMDHIRRSDGVGFNTESKGLGDVKLSGLLSLYETDSSRLHMNLGMSFPTGSINQRDETLAGTNQKLPYPMQIGSGTYDLHPGLTYAARSDKFSWGAQSMFTVRLQDENNNNYRLGNQYNVTTWAAYQWADFLSQSLRLKWSVWEDIEGADLDLNSNMIQTADTDNSGGERIDLLFGLNLIGTGDFLEGHRLALEVGLPVYQDLDGPQLGVDLQYTLAWQKAF